MFKYVLKRIIGLIPVLFSVSVVVFIITRVLPGNPAEVMLGPQATAEAIKALELKLGINDPWLVQYGRFLLDLLQGDLGTSIAYHQPVLNLILDTLPNTILLTVAALFIAIIVAIPIGIISAVKQYSIFDYISMTFALIGVSLPVYWLGLMMVLIFSTKLQILPAIGMGSMANGLWDVISHLILPSIALSTIPMANLARITRSSMLEVVRQDYIRTARAKGLSEWIVIGKHSLKNALVPIITVMGMQISMMLSGAVLTETIFAWPGMGRLIVDAIEKRDFIMVQGSVMFLALMFVIINLIVDLLYVWVNPRISYDNEGGN
ncbi:peptide/nickel transport system permease protein [Desulfonispora thiosulfatigenes DSM 11270]|uniref:Peptide/nickel transport system permease protein n=1 Tax=Desulfonispora thiosulfatigenes DSM 11270 TaxID=656914 RepID=A0A1W1UKL9_DESTI|nr:ABC transporter permease [Desulfonispora thiosulfatigenes]SMB81602.1 peptide/nickel transport system permease protein [Desulfonispora thiosulfatigenes DSM 11270]